MPTTNPKDRDRFWRTLAIVLIAAMAANISLGYLRKATAPPEPPAIQVRELVVTSDPKLDRTLTAVDFDDVNLEQALANLVHQADLNLVVLWKPVSDIGVEKDMPVTLHLKNVSVSTALDSVLSLADVKNRIAWTEHGGVITVVPAESLDQSHLTLRIYDVKHLISVRFPVSNSPSMDLQNASQGQTQNQSQQQSPQTMEENQLDEIKKFITDNVATTTWKDNGGDVGSISSFGDLLLITQTEQAQQKIAALLNLVDRK
jgi:hypothetical protein